MNGHRSESVEYIAQPSLWDRLKNDLPGLALEARAQRQSLSDDIGADKLDRILAGTARPEEETTLSGNQLSAIRALGENERKCRSLVDAGIVVTPQDVISSVHKDIEALLNTARYDCTLLRSEAEEKQHTDTYDLSEYPEVQTSVVNYGIAPLLGALQRSIDAEEVAQTIREALVNFEPRLNRDNLRVDVRRSRNTSPGSSPFEVVISGEVMVSPAPEHMIFVAEIDLNTAKATARSGEN